MSTIPLRLHHYSVWQPTHQTIKKDADSYKAGLQAYDADNGATANTGFAMHQCFLIQSPDPKGRFQCAIPMKHVLSLKHGDDISDIAGLLMGKNSPLKNIPVLGWLL